MDTAPKTPADIPADFPTTKTPASLAGVQLKLTARFIDGKYVTDYTDEELAQRYAVCQDLVTQLIPYSLKKQAELAHLTVDQLLGKIGLALNAKDWGLSDLEIQWILTQLRPSLTTSGE